MIRVATIHDIPMMVAIGREMHAESRHATTPYDEQRVAAILRYHIEHEDGCALIAERDGKIIGGHVAFVMEQWFSTDLVAHNLALFVLPWERGGMAAIRLVREYISWARAEGERRGRSVSIQLGTSSGIAEGRAAKFFQRLGFKPAGVICELS